MTGLAAQRLAEEIGGGDWKLQALCKPDTADELWTYDGKSTAVKQERIREAKQWCAICPVTAECYADAVARNETFGVCGGVDFGSRKVQRELHPRSEPGRGPQCGTVAGSWHHYKRNERLCEDCAVVKREDQRRRRAQKKQEKTAC